MEVGEEGFTTKAKGVRAMISATAEKFKTAISPTRDFLQACDEIIDRVEFLEAFLRNLTIRQSLFQIQSGPITWSEDDSNKYWDTLRHLVETEEVRMLHDGSVHYKDMAKPLCREMIESLSKHRKVTEKAYEQWHT